MDPNVLNSLKHMETQLEYLRSIENLTERVVAATEAVRDQMERLTKAMEDAKQQYDAMVDQQNQIRK